jgi:hypothetical protein
LGAYWDAENLKCVGSADVRLAEEVEGM